MTFLQILLLSAVFYFILRPLYLGFRFAYPPRIKIKFYTPTSLGVSYEDVTLTTRDNVKLVGWYIHSRNGASILLIHGYGVNRLELIHHAEALVRAGYGVLMLDLRAHGLSGGRTFGRSERLVGDVLTAVTWLRKRPDITDAGLGILGLGVGGVFALHAAAKTVAVRSVIVDGVTVATMGDFPQSKTPFAKLLGRPIQRLFMFVAEYLAKLPPLEANTAVVSRISPRPLMIISGGRGLGYRISQRLYDTAVEPKQLWHIPEAPHHRSSRSRPEEYHQKMVHFFNQYLRLDMQSETDPVEISAPPPSPQEPKLEDVTISFVWANILALLTIPISFVLFLLPYFLLWGEIPSDPFQFLNVFGILGIILIFVVSIVAHELLHAIGYTAVGKAAWSDVKFGFSWEGLSPYAHCQAAMRAGAYKTAVALPGVMLGILPALAGIALENWGLLLYGIGMFIAAGGDLAVLLSIRHVSNEKMVLDHPTQVGCQIVKSS